VRGAVFHIRREVGMTELRAKFIEYLELKGYASASIRNYVQIVAQFSRFVGHSPLKLPQEEIRTYLLNLLE
jgi:hypothetical protein